MMVTLASTEWNPAGYIELRAIDSQNRGETRRRVNRQATLDGSAVLIDQGMSEADRSITVEWMSMSRADEAAVERLVQLYSRINVSIDGAVYLAAPEAYVPGDETSQLRLLVLSKVSA